MGFVLIRLILLRLDPIHTRRAGLRAANWNASVGISSVLSLCRRLLSLVLLWAARLFRLYSLFVILPVSVAKRFAWRFGGCTFEFCLCFLFSSLYVSRLPFTSVFGLAPFFSFLSRPFSFLFGRASLPLSLSLSVRVYLSPRVSRLTLIITFWSSR